MNNASPKTAIVIGGGIAGCSTAYMLAKRGIKVTLLERHADLASEASGNPLAVLYPRLTAQQTALEKLNIFGYHYSLQLLQELGLTRCQYNACGVIQLATDHKQQERNKLLADEYHDEFFRSLDADQLSEIAGVKLSHSGLYFPNAGGIQLAHLCAVLTQHANIRVLSNTEALTIQKTDTGWQVSTDSETMAETEIIVIANANDAAQFRQSAYIPLTAIRGQLTQLQPSETSKKLETILCGDGYLSPVIAGQHCLGATFNPNDTDTDIRLQDHQHNLALLKKISPTLYESLQNNIVSGRVAWRSQTPDYLPAAGQLLDLDMLANGQYFYNDSAAKLPWANGLYANLGHGAKGFLSAPLCAAIISAHVTNATSPAPIELLNALQPNRFILRKMGLKLLAQHLISA